MLASGVKSEGAWGRALGLTERNFRTMRPGDYRLLTLMNRRPSGSLISRSKGCRPETDVVEHGESPAIIRKREGQKC